MFRALIFDSSVWRGMPSFAAAPEGPEIRPVRRRERCLNQLLLAFGERPHLAHPLGRPAALILQSSPILGMVRESLSELS